MPELLPHDTETELAILGACMMQPEAESKLLSWIEPGDFWGDSERIIAKTLKAMSGNGEPLAPDAVVMRLRSDGLLQRVGGAEYIVGVIGATPAIAPGRMGMFLRRLRDMRQRRDIVGVLRGVSAAASDATASDAQSLIDEAQGRLQAIAGRHDKDTFHTVKGSTKDLFMQIEADTRARAEGKFVRASTGIMALDNVIGGLHKGQLVVVAARPSMGKTAFALGMAYSVSKTPLCPRQGAHIISAETTSSRIASRIVSSVAQVETGRVLRGELSPAEWSKLTKASNEVSELPITIDDRSAPTLQHLRASIRRAQRKHRKVDAEGRVTCELGAVFVDYLQLATVPDSKSREQEVGAIAYGLHAIAKDFNVAMVALSQLNRAAEARQNKRPMLSDLRESGNIEQAADVILGLYRDEYYKRTPENAGMAEVLVLKAKEGRCGSVRVRFVPEWMTFADVEEW